MLLWWDWRVEKSLILKLKTISVLQTKLEVSSGSLAVSLCEFVHFGGNAAKLIVRSTPALDALLLLILRVLVRIKRFLCVREIIFDWASCCWFLSHHSRVMQNDSRVVFGDYLNWFGVGWAWHCHELVPCQCIDFLARIRTLLLLRESRDSSLARARSAFCWSFLYHWIHRGR